MLKVIKKGLLLVLLSAVAVTSGFCAVKPARVTFTLAEQEKLQYNPYIQIRKQSSQAQDKVHYSIFEFIDSKNCTINHLTLNSAEELSFHNIPYKQLKETHYLTISLDKSRTQGLVGSLKSNNQKFFSISIGADQHTLIFTQSDGIQIIVNFSKGQFSGTLPITTHDLLPHSWGKFWARFAPAIYKRFFKQTKEQYFYTADKISTN